MQRPPSEGASRPAATLVTGGAGYVAGPVVRRLLDSGQRVVVLDDLSTSSGRTIPHDAVLVRGSIGDGGALREVFGRWSIAAVFHLAAGTRPGQSMREPLRFYRANVVDSLTLIEAVVAAGCPPFVFSSSASVYGPPDRVPVSEDAPLRPVSPYAETKRAVEEALRWVGQAHGLPWAALRYFNAAGADGPYEHKALGAIIPSALSAVREGRPVDVFGTDYPTPDGTCIRDFVHVADLAEGHLAALRHLSAGGASSVYNLGTGRGHSVAEVLAAVESVCGCTLERRVGPRRPGDFAVSVADASRAAAVLGWTPQCSDLRRIIRDQWNGMRGEDEAAHGAAAGGS